MRTDWIEIIQACDTPSLIGLSQLREHLFDMKLVPVVDVMVKLSAPLREASTLAGHIR